VLFFPFSLLFARSLGWLAASPRPARWFLPLRAKDGYRTDYLLLTAMRVPPCGPIMASISLLTPTETGTMAVC